MQPRDQPTTAKLLRIGASITVQFLFAIITRSVMATLKSRQLLMCRSLAARTLAAGTEESRTLGLNGADDSCLAALGTFFAVFLVNAVSILESARLVLGVAIVAVGEGGALAKNGFVKDLAHFGVYPLPIDRPQSIAGDFGVNARPMEDFGGVDISNSGNRALVEDGHLDGSSADGKALAKIGRRNIQCVRSQLVGPQVACQLPG